MVFSAFACCHSSALLYSWVRSLVYLVLVPWFLQRGRALHRQRLVRYFLLCSRSLLMVLSLLLDRPFNCYELVISHWFYSAWWGSDSTLVASPLRCLLLRCWRRSYRAFALSLLSFFFGCIGPLLSSQMVMFCLFCACKELRSLFAQNSAQSYV